MIDDQHLPRARVLLVEDDRELLSMLVRLLEGEGYVVATATDGETGRQRALNEAFDAVILDRGLPLLDGLDLLSRLRRRGWRTPVLVLSAYGAARDRVQGLDAGAEDYLVKPFDVDELLARLRALLRRHDSEAVLLPILGGVLDPQSRQVQLDAGSQVELSAREANLLGTLARRPGRVFTRDELLLRVFDEAETDTVVDTYVHYLRRKLGRGVIRTVRGVGYQVAPARGENNR
jgi:two-component system response regulator QseB